MLGVTRFAHLDRIVVGGLQQVHDVRDVHDVDRVGKVDGLAPMLGGDDDGGRLALRELSVMHSHRPRCPRPRQGSAQAWPTRRRTRQLRPQAKPA